MDPKRPNTPPEPIRFKPLNDGLGFHPFSDGLPYAPPPPLKRPPTGTGAVSAGPPIYVTARRPSIEAPRPRPGVSVRATAPALASSEVGKEDAPGFEYLARRLLAYVFDFTAGISVGGGALLLAIWRIGAGFSPIADPWGLGLLAAFLVIFAWAATLAQEVILGTSLGKLLWGLRVSGSAPRLLLRAAALPLSVLPLGLGLSASLIDRRRRCWHDRIAGVQPEEVASL